MPFETVKRFRNIDRFYVEDRLAAFQRLDNGQFMGVSFHELDKAPHDAFALTRMGARPHASLKGLSSLLDCKIHVLLPAAGDFDEDFPGRRIDRVKSSSASGRPG